MMNIRYDARLCKAVCMHIHTNVSFSAAASGSSFKNATKFEV